MRIFMKENWIYVNDIRIKVLLIDKERPYLLNSYLIKLKKGNDNLELNIEDFLYKLTEENRTQLIDDIYYERPNLWELKLFKNSFFMEIPSFEKVSDRVRKILIDYFHFDRDILDIVEYFYAKSELDIYIRSFRNPKKACEMFYKYRMETTKSFDNFISGDFGRFLRGNRVKRGGEFCGCYIDDKYRKRPITSPVYYAMEYNVQDIFTFRTVLNLPKWFRFHIASKYVTEEEILDCYGGREKAIKGLQQLNINITDDTRSIKILKLIAFNSNNELISRYKFNSMILNGIEGENKYLEIYEKFRCIIEKDFNILFKFIFIHNKTNRDIENLLEY